MLINLTTTRGINFANIILMLVSCAIAFVLPFELFLFSYAVLGPLHYLTEISWLHKSNYYTKNKYDFLWLVVFGLLTTISSIFPEIMDKITKGLLSILPGLEGWNIGSNVIFVGFMLSLIFVLIKTNYVRFLAVFVLVIISFIFQDNNFYILFFTIFLPTLIHVFIFTFIFLLYGAMKSNSASGYASAVVMIGCSLACLFILPSYSGHQISDYVRESYKNFSEVNFQIINLFHLEDLSHSGTDIFGVIYNSPTGVVVMRFIAFAYTYHYLNWFSKTSVIKWHEVPKVRMAIVLILWLSAIGFYAYDYNLGLKVLFLLSFMHVYLEFPLNFHSFIGMGRVAKGWFQKPKLA